MATAAIEATATISAATVAAVRRRLRVAFSAPNRTVIPRGGRCGAAVRPAHPRPAEAPPPGRRGTARPGDDPTAVGGRDPPSTSAAPPTATATATWPTPAAGTRQQSRPGRTHGGVRPARAQPAATRRRPQWFPSPGRTRASPSAAPAQVGASPCWPARPVVRPSADPHGGTDQGRHGADDGGLGHHQQAELPWRGADDPEAARTRGARRAASIDRVLKIRNEPTARARTPKRAGPRLRSRESRSPRRCRPGRRGEDRPPPPGR